MEIAISNPIYIKLNIYVHIESISKKNLKIISFECKFNLKILILKTQLKIIPY